MHPFAVSVERNYFALIYSQLRHIKSLVGRALLRKGKCESFGPKDSSDNDYDDKNYGELF